MPSPDYAQILNPFGFTPLESDIYVFLLGESPATGYRVAQAIGKAAANTYKAIESLQQKGAILVEEGSSRLCRAVSPDELLARFARDFEWSRAAAEQALSRMANQGEDDRVYSLRSRGQVIERARHMLYEAQRVALVACGAASGHQLKDALLACAGRGVAVSVLCDEALGIEGAQESKPAQAAARKPDELRVAVDGKEHLIALFGSGREEVAQAVWSKSLYLSANLHRGLSAEIAASQAGLKASHPVEATEGYSQLLGSL